MNSKYEIREHKSIMEVEFVLKDFYGQYEGKIYEHKNGGQYIIVDTIVININGSSFLGLVYCPYEDGVTFSKVRHSRPMYEFEDGRFTEVTE